jgi:hypothetical protein
VCAKINHLTREKVCKNFLSSTLDTSSGRFTRATFGAKDIGVAKHERRGWEGTTPIPELQKQSVRDHINSFPKYTGHYTRHYNNPHTKYLPQHLSIKKMYKLYVDKCEKNITPVKEWQYHHTFNNEFNFSLILILATKVTFLKWL